MAIPAMLTALSGTWQGTKQLWLDPDQPACESRSTATVRQVAQGRFLVLEYTWSDQGKPQDGMLVFGEEAPSGGIRAFWMDSWHMRDTIMPCDGAVGSDGGIWVQGSYAAPPDPDWGWRIALHPETDHAFRMRMHNIAPDGQESLAVEIRYTR